MVAGDNLKVLKEYIKKIKERFHPQQVFLFGSYAYGKPKKDSDIDILVIMKTRLRPLEQAVIIRKELPFFLPLDLIVRTPKEVKKRIRQGDFFLKTVLEKGKRLL